jgi:hypothetical protein
MAELARKYNISPSEWLSAGFDCGILSVDREIQKERAHIALPDLSRSTLEVAQKFSADKITNLTAFAKNKINTALTLGIMGEKSPFEVIKEIGRNLKDPSVFRTIAVRAETITRAEINRVYSKARQQRQSQTAKVIPGLHKRWIHAHFANYPRIWHIAMHGKTIPASGKFTVGGEKMMHPYDPAASAKNVIGCKCTTKTILPEDVGKKEKASLELPVMGGAGSKKKWRQFSSRRSADRWARDTFGNWAGEENLTDEEFGALRNYKILGYENVNKYLRTGRVPSGVDREALKQRIKMIDQVLERHNLKDNIIVYRMVNLKKEIVDEGYGVGNIVDDKAFMSTSLLKEKPAEIVQQLPKEREVRVFLKIKAPKGAHAVYLDDVVHAGSGLREQELLFQRKTRLKILSKRTEGDIIKIVAEMIL